MFRKSLWRFAISFIVWSKGDVWVFRVFCRRARWFFEGPTCFGTCLSSGLQICRAGRYFFLSLEGSVGNVSPVFRFRFRSVFGRFGLGFRWCLAFSHPLPTRVFVAFCYLFHSVIQRWRLGVSTSSLVFWRPNLFWDMSFQRLADLSCWKLFFSCL